MCLMSFYLLFLGANFVHHNFGGGITTHFRGGGLKKVDVDFTYFLVYLGKLHYLWVGEGDIMLAMKYVANHPE